MGITRTVIGVVAAAGVARLLAPKETDRAVKAVKGTVGKGVRSVGREAEALMPARAKAAASRTKRAVKSGASKTAKAATKVRKAAQRPKRKASK